MEPEQEAALGELEEELKARALAELEEQELQQDCEQNAAEESAGQVVSKGEGSANNAVASPTEDEDLVAEIGKGVAKLADATGELLSAESRQQSDRLREQLVAAGAPEPLAARVAHLYDLDGAVGLAKLASETGIPPIGLTEAFTEVGHRLGLDWAQSTAALMSPSDVWERLLVSGLARDFQQMRLELLRRLARRKDAKKDMPGIVAKWAEEQSAAVHGFRAMVARAQGQSPVAPAMLAQIASMARNLLGR